MNQHQQSWQKPSQAQGRGSGEQLGLDEREGEKEAAAAGGLKGDSEGQGSLCSLASPGRVGALLPPSSHSKPASGAQCLAWRTCWEVMQQGKVGGAQEG